MGIASLIIGLVTIIIGVPSLFGMSLHIPILSFLGAGNIFSIPLNIVGLILGIIALRKKTRRGIALAGLILNALSLLYFIAIIAMWGILGD